MEAYVIMVKRSDKKIYCDLHKTNCILYLTEADAQEALSKYEFPDYYHIVNIVCEVSKNSYE